MATTKGRPNRAESALRDWLDELPAIAASLDVDAGARAVILADAASDEKVVTAADGKAHPVLVARGHLAQAALNVCLAEAARDAEAATRAVEHCEQAFEVGDSLQASGARLAIVAPAGALAALALGRLRAAERRGVQRLLSDVANAVGEAMAEQAEDERRGVDTLTAARSLVGASKTVRGKARAAVLERARQLAVDAHHDLARAGALEKAALARSTTEQIEAALTPR